MVVTSHRNILMRQLTLSIIREVPNTNVSTNTVLPYCLDGHFIIISTVLLGRQGLPHP